MASLAWSREKPSSDPVTTMVAPATVLGLDSSTSSAIRTSAFFHLSTISTCHWWVNHSWTDSAITGPTPSTPASSSRDAARIASIDCLLYTSDAADEEASVDL